MEGKGKLYYTCQSLKWRGYACFENKDSKYWPLLGVEYQQTEIGNN